MKKFLLLLVAFALVFCACDNGGEADDGTIMILNQNTRLTIFNQSLVTIYVPIVWNGTEIRYSDGSFYSPLEPGYNVTRNVTPGSSYIMFKGIDSRTQELITIKRGQSKTFIFLDSTVVVDGNGNTMTLKEFAQ